MERTTLTRSVVTDVHAAVELMATAAGGLDSVWQLRDADVESGLSALVRLQAHTAALEAVLLAEAGSRDLKAGTQASTLVRWLGDRFRLSRADGNTRVRAAEALGRHAVVTEALATGAVTVEQGEVLTRVLETVETFPGVAEGERTAAGRFLVAQCDALAPRDLERAGRAMVEALTASPSVDDPADAEALAREQQRAEAQAQDAERSLLSVTRRRGRVLAILEPGTIGQAALQQWMRKNGQPHAGTDGSEDTRTRSERLGDALVDLLTAAAGAPTPPAHSDELVDLVEDEPEIDGQEPLPVPAVGAARGGSAPDLCGSCGRPGPAPATAVLTVTTTVDGLRSGLAKAGRLDTGIAMSAAALRMLACDALVVPAVLSTASEVLDLGRAYRVFNRAQRRATALRDGGCVAPGCDQPPSACHLHHMWWWIQGGRTDLDNAALLCGFHHRMVHRQGWAMCLASNGYPQLVPPTSIDPQQRPRQHHRFTLDAVIAAARCESRPGRLGSAPGGAVIPHRRT